MNLVEILKNEFGSDTFSRKEFIAVCKKNNVPVNERKVFLQDPTYKQSHGVYCVEPEPEEPEVPETDEEILKRITDRFDILEKLSESAAFGETRALIVSGPPGLGKTYTVTETIEPAAANCKIMSGSASAAGLYRALWETRLKGSCLIIDDCDSVFFDVGALNLIKAACDSTKKRVIRWCSDYHFSSADSDRPEKEFDYNGTVVFITNIDFDSSIKKGSKIAPHIEALMSRAHYISLGIKNRRDYLIRIEHVIKQMYTSGEFGKEEAIDAIRFIRENQGQLRELSIRTAIKLTQLRKSLLEDWERCARITMCKGH